MCQQTDTVCTLGGLSGQIGEHQTPMPDLGFGALHLTSAITVAKTILRLQIRHTVRPGTVQRGGSARQERARGRSGNTAGPAAESPGT